MNYKLRRLQLSDGSWARFKDAWESQSDAIGYTLEDYASGAMPVLASYAVKDVSPSRHRKAWTMALYSDSEKPMLALCVNVAPIPNYKDPVTRVRQITVSPDLDEGIEDDDVYSSVLVATLQQIYALSNTEFSSRHIHMHLRSPADVAFFKAFGSSLNGDDVFESVNHGGAWLRLSKKTLLG